MAVQTTIKIRRDTAANWASTNPVLSAGEFGLETDTGKLKIGDGTSASWTNLTYTTDATKLSNATSLGVANVRSGDWLSFCHGATSPAAPRAQGQEYCQFVRFPFNVTLDRIATFVQTGGSTGAVVRLGIRNDNNGRPGTVLVDAGTAAAETNSSFPTITINQTLLANTTYWLSATAQGTPTTGAITRIPVNVWLPGIVGQTGLSSVTSIGYWQSGVTGALPSTFTVGGLVQLNNADGYTFQVRFA